MQHVERIERLVGRSQPAFRARKIATDRFSLVADRMPFGNIAKGHAIGYERESIGGNLACAKRGLRAANEALDSLHVLHERAVLDRSEERRVGKECRCGWCTELYDEV